MANESTRQNTLAEAIRRHIDAALDELHTMLPGVVTSYDAKTQKVSVKPLVKHAYIDEDENRQVESLSVINNVPVRFMSAGGFAVTCPISDGNLVIEGQQIKATKGMLIFAEASIAAWKNGDGGEVDPGFDHRHQVSDAVFVPGLNPFSSPLLNVPTDHMAFGFQLGPKVRAHTTGIVVAQDNQEAQAQAVALVGQLVALAQVFKTWVPVSMDGGAALKTALAALIASGWPGQAAPGNNPSQTLKAQ